MSTAQIREIFPVRYGVALIAILVMSFVYAVLIGQLGPWVWGAAAMVSLGLTLFVIYLFYRLVFAVEEIAYK